MSALDRQEAVITAVRSALEADSALSSLIGLRVYDAPPARATMPSITIRLANAQDASTADTEAQSLAFDLDVWDRYAAGADLSRPRALMAHIRRILHMQSISVSGVSVLTCRCTAAVGPFRDPDEIALHGVVTLTILAGHEAAFD